MLFVQRFNLVKEQEILHERESRPKKHSANYLSWSLGGTLTNHRRMTTPVEMIRERGVTL